MSADSTAFIGHALFPIKSFDTKVLLHATDFTTIDILLPNPSNTLKDVLIPHLLQFRGIYHLLTFEFSMGYNGSMENIMDMARIDINSLPPQ